MKRRMVVLLVDALGWNLASAAPGFAAPLEHRRKLDTVLGFSSGALPTLFTGRMPCEHGRFLMYRRRSADSPFRGFGALRALPKRLQSSGMLSRALTRLVRRRGVRGYFNLYEVPRPILAEFDLAERADVFSPGGLPLPSLWDTLEKSGVPWAHRDWRTPEQDNLAWLERELESTEFLFVYTADLDAQLHHEGSRGSGVRESLSRYDAVVGRLTERAKRSGEDLWIYLLSDHGMVDVARTEDVMARLAGLAVGWPRDYVAFFDSTMARFWWRRRAARESVRAALEGAPGRWLDAGDLDREGTRFADAAYGEDLFLLDPGVLMVPSFMGTSPLAAMHGYDPSHPDMAALLWSNRPIPREVGHLRDVRGFLESELDALTGSAA
ncbi:MAG: alkaline phosphatase family protein [Candidatus Eisenbacteria bacterium]|nr:alkaline phosphatase family protein [Candidatus Eisenbacteria bacterium]